MGRAVMDSINGLEFELVCERYQARGKESIKSIKVVVAASLNERINGS